MPITFPENCNLARERVEYCYRAKALLRTIHNFVGRWHREGITLAEYNQLPNKIKNQIPYGDGMLSEQLWSTWKENYYYPKEKEILDKFAQNQALLEQSTEWAIDIDDI